MLMFLKLSNFFFQIKLVFLEFEKSLELELMVSYNKVGKLGGCFTGYWQLPDIYKAFSVLCPIVRKELDLVKTLEKRASGITLSTQAE